MMRIISLIDDDQRRILDNLLTELSRSMSLGMSSLEMVIRRDSLARPSMLRLGFRARRSSWVWKKDTIDAIIADLEAWQSRFDPSWFLLIKIANPVIDRELAQARTTETAPHGPATAAQHPLALAAGIRSVLLPTADQSRSIILPESPMEWLNIPFSTARAGRQQSSRDTRWYIVDTIEIGQVTRLRDLWRDVRVLAAKLSQADPLAFGLLNCKGVVAVQLEHAAPAPAPQLGSAFSPSPAVHLPPARTPSPSQRDYAQFQLIFRIPHGMEVLQSLRQLLLNPDAHISLSQKVRIARELVKAVNYVHTFDFVHKNVRPESVLCFEDTGASRSHAFLVGFDAFRATSSGTMMGGDMSWDRNVYRHPSRQGMDPAERYRMQHDIYSLGVCLLEIGLWESFVEYTDENEIAGPPQPNFGKSYYHFQTWLRSQETPPSFQAMAFKLKDYLVEQARTRLAPRMGDRYAQVAILCLSCLDNDNEDFAGVEEDASDDFVAVQFIEKVMKSIDEILV